MGNVFSIVYRLLNYPALRICEKRPPVFRNFPGLPDAWTRPLQLPVSTVGENVRDEDCPDRPQGVVFAGFPD